eukprot:6371508-Amphidinium_carterae.1
MSWRNSEMHSARMAMMQSLKLDQVNHATFPTLKEHCITDRRNADESFRGITILTKSISG